MTLCFSYDSLTIYDGGTNTSSMIGKFNYPAPSAIYTTTNEAFVHFQARENSQNLREPRFGIKIVYNPTSKHIS